VLQRRGGPGTARCRDDATVGFDVGHRGPVGVGRGENPRKVVQVEHLYGVVVQVVERRFSLSESRGRPVLDVGDVALLSVESGDVGVGPVAGAGVDADGVAVFLDGGREALTRGVGGRTRPRSRHHEVAVRAGCGPAVAAIAAVTTVTAVAAVAAGTPGEGERSGTEAGRCEKPSTCRLSWLLVCHTVAKRPRG
jgi:hypothetical protein